MMKGVRAAGPMPPMGPRPISGTAEPSEPSRNISAATIRPPLRPSALEMGPPTPAPMTQPSSADDTAQPDSESRAASGNPLGTMKLWSMADTAPEITAVS